MDAMQISSMQKDSFIFKINGNHNIALVNKETILERLAHVSMQTKKSGESAFTVKLMQSISKTFQVNYYSYGK